MNIEVTGPASALLDRVRIEYAKKKPAELQTDHPGPPHHQNLVVYVPQRPTRGFKAPSRETLKTQFRALLNHAPKKVVVLSSAEVHPARHQHPGMVEAVSPVRVKTDSIAEYWLAVEQTATEVLGDRHDLQLIILRLAPILLTNGKDFYNRLLQRGIALTVFGFDPNLQFLEPSDAIKAITAALSNDVVGIVNVAPTGTMPLKKALRRAGVIQVPLPWTLHWLFRKLTAPLGWVFPLEQVNRLRYPFTIAEDLTTLSIKTRSTFTAVSETKNLPAVSEEPSYDPHGCSSEYLSFQMSTQLRFLHDAYWRVRYEGMEQIPSKGRALLVGVHRGFMPYDGAMMLYGVMRALQRNPRFLIHPCLVKQPILAPFISKLGGMIACGKNADAVLQQNNLLGIFPEGIQGAFTPYKDAYTLGNFGRDEYIRIALRNQAPIVPFITVGSAEIYPILGRINWGFWRRFSEWPCIPLTPTFPLLPVPLPTKWHTKVLAPIPIHEHYPPEAADDRAVVARLGQEIKAHMQSAFLALRSRRKSLFMGPLLNEPLMDSAPEIHTRLDIEEQESTP